MPKKKEATSEKSGIDTKPSYSAAWFLDKFPGFIPAFKWLAGALNTTTPSDTELATSTDSEATTNSPDDQPPQE